MATWIDTHCHLDASEFLGSILDVRQRARDAGVGLCVVPAVQASGFGAVRALAHAAGDAYALGIHRCTRTARRRPIWWRLTPH